MHNEKVRALAVTAVAAVMLIATIASIATNSNVFAYSRNQATVETNDCGNGQAPTNIGCQNTDSQIQGDENTVALASQQTFPSVTREPPTPPTPEEECRECFTPITRQRT